MAVFEHGLEPCPHPPQARQRGGLGVGTINGQGGLAGKLGQIFLSMQTMGLGILCLQDVQVTPDTIPAAQAAAQAVGYELMFSATDRDAAGRPYSGTAILSSWPIKNGCNRQKKSSPKMLCKGSTNKKWFMNVP